MLPLFEIDNIVSVKLPMSSRSLSVVVIVPALSPIESSSLKNVDVPKPDNDGVAPKKSNKIAIFWKLNKNEITRNQEDNKKNNRMIMVSIQSYSHLMNASFYLRFLHNSYVKV